MKNFILTCFAMVVLLTGCARDILVMEVLQIPDQAVVRTAYNLWYEDPMEMDTINAQRGKILQFGTPVTFTDVTDKKIKFKTNDGTEFAIEFESNYRLETAEEYIRETFTTKTPEEMHVDIDALTYEKIKRGIVEKGMSKKAVVLAFGPPCAFRTPNMDAKTWIYPIDFLEYKRVVFKGDHVLDVLYPMAITDKKAEKKSEKESPKEKIEEKVNEKK